FYTARIVLPSGDGTLVILTVDGKAVVMRTEDLREDTGKASEAKGGNKMATRTSRSTGASTSPRNTSATTKPATSTNTTSQSDPQVTAAVSTPITDRARSYSTSRVSAYRRPAGYQPSDRPPMNVLSRPAMTRSSWVEK